MDLFDCVHPRFGPLTPPPPPPPPRHPYPDFAARFPHESPGIKTFYDELLVRGCVLPLQGYCVATLPCSLTKLLCAVAPYVSTPLPPLFLTPTARFPHESSGIKKFYDECWAVFNALNSLELKSLEEPRWAKLTYRFRFCSKLWFLGGGALKRAQELGGTQVVATDTWAETVRVPGVCVGGG